MNGSGVNDSIEDDLESEVPDDAAQYYARLASRASSAAANRPAATVSTATNANSRQTLSRARVTASPAPSVAPSTSSQPAPSRLAQPQFFASSVLHQLQSGVAAAAKPPAAAEPTFSQSDAGDEWRAPSAQRKASVTRPKPASSSYADAHAVADTRSTPAAARPRPHSESRASQQSATVSVEPASALSTDEEIKRAERLRFLQGAAGASQAASETQPRSTTSTRPAKRAVPPVVRGAAQASKVNRLASTSVPPSHDLSAASATRTIDSDSTAGNVARAGNFAPFLSSQVASQQQTTATVHLRKTAVTTSPAVAAAPTPVATTDGSSYAASAAKKPVSIKKKKKVPVISALAMTEFDVHTTSVPDASTAPPPTATVAPAATRSKSAAKTRPLSRQQQATTDGVSRAHDHASSVQPAVAMASQPTSVVPPPPFPMHPLHAHPHAPFPIYHQFQHGTNAPTQPPPPYANQFYPPFYPPPPAAAMQQQQQQQQPMHQSHPHAQQPPVPPYPLHLLPPHLQQQHQQQYPPPPFGRGYPDGSAGPSQPPFMPTTTAQPTVLAAPSVTRAPIATGPVTSVMTGAPRPAPPRGVVASSRPPMPMPVPAPAPSVEPTLRAAAPRAARAPPPPVSQSVAAEQSLLASLDRLDARLHDIAGGASEGAASAALHTRNTAQVKRLAPRTQK